MFARHLATLGGVVAVCLALGATGARAQCSATQLCAPGPGDCVIDKNCTVPPGSTFELGARGLVIQSDTTLTVDTGVAPLTIHARSVLLQPNAQIVAKGQGGVFASGGRIGLFSDDTITLQSQGAKHAVISAAGGNGGILFLQATNDIVVAGALQAQANTSAGIGGDITVKSMQGDIHVSGAGIRVDGGNDVDNGASGGSLGLDAHGSVVIDALLDDSDGDCGDTCEIDVSAATGDVTVTTNGSLDVSGGGSVASGGDVVIDAAGAVQISGSILGTSTGIGGADGEGGDGGGLTIKAGAGVTLAGQVLLSGSSLDGEGGSVDVESGGDIVLPASGSLLVPTTGIGGGGSVLARAGGNASITGPVDARGDEFGGSIEIDATGVVTIAGALNADSRHPTVENGGTGGSITINACTISAPDGAIISSVGPGLAPNATNHLVASGHMTLGCQLHAGTDGDDPHNVLEAPSNAAIGFLASIDAVPPPFLVENPELPSCCEGCGTTTTTSTATTTTLATPPTTAPGVTTTTTTTPGGATTTAPGATTTTSPGPGTPTTTLAPSDCTELPLVGFEALTCRLGMMRLDLGGLPVESLGGKKVGRLLTGSLGRATSAMQGAQQGKKVPANLRRARKQLRVFLRALNRAQRKGMPPDVWARLQSLASEAAAEIDSLRASVR